MDFDDFEWSQGAPTPATMSETMCDMFSFRKKKKVFLWKMNFRHFAPLCSYAEGELRHENRGFHENHWFLLKIMDFDDFECSQGAPTPPTTSETMRDMFLFRKKKYNCAENSFFHKK